MALFRSLACFLVLPASLCSQIGGQCCWGGCGGWCGGGWCAESQERCESSCNGQYCTGTNPPGPPPPPPPPPLPPPPPPSPGWQQGTATYYGNSGTGGHCGGTELWPDGYGSGQGWIDGLYVATASHLWCGQDGDCGDTHSFDCGRCYELKCTGTDTNTDGYVPCSSNTVTVAVTDECPASAEHCGGTVNHFDLSTKAFDVIGSQQAGKIHVDFRVVPCPVKGANLKLEVLGNQHWFKVGALDATGAVAKLEVKTATLGGWTTLEEDYGQFWKKTSNIGSGPYEFRITGENGQQLLYTTQTLASGTFDVGANFRVV